jgi:amidase
MNRRAFLRIGGASAMAMFNWPAVADTLPTAKARNPYHIRPFELEEATIGELQAGLRTGKFSAVALAKQYLARIDSIDRRGPCLKSVLELNPEALEIAASLDTERKSRGPRSPLHGIPVLIKDNIDTHDRMTTTAGSLALAGSIPPRDAFLVERLRTAGAVILGKTNLSEWANFRGSLSTSGWSARGGQTRNPYILDRNPSGSSSGSAVAVSANLCAVAVGTETDGSILSPASYTGIVGLKPTVGLISRSGIIPISHTQDTAGPMARTVTDAALLLGGLVGVDPRDPATSQSAGKSHEDYTTFLNPHSLRGARIGVARAFFGAHRRVDELMEFALASLKALGADLVDRIELSRSPKQDEAELEVFRYELKADMNAYLAALGPNAPAHTLQELIVFNERRAAEELRWFGQEEFIKAQAKGPLTEQAYLDALATCRRISRNEGIDAAMEKHNLDAIVAPTSTPAHVTDWVVGDHGLGDSTSPAAVAGYPSITVPMGFVFGLPVGISFFGRAWSEGPLLGLAFAFEQTTRVRRPPRFLSTIEVQS